MWCNGGGGGWRLAAGGVWAEKGGSGRREVVRVMKPGGVREKPRSGSTGVNQLWYLILPKLLSDFAASSKLTAGFSGYAVVCRFTESVHKVNIWIMDRPTIDLLVPSGHTMSDCEIVAHKVEFSDQAFTMSILTKLRCITLDVTGTLIAYKGELGDYYCMAAKAAGQQCPDYKRVHEGFKLAYTEMAKKHPCFGFAEKIPNIVWWKTCVRNSFVQAGYEYDEETFEKIFRRIYATFGSSAPYSIFPDAKPFLRWLRESGITVGLVSNAEYRYQDVILPALGLNQGSEWDFGVFSGLEGVEKPDPRIYEIALKKAGNVAPQQVLHIGDSMRKDYLPARSVGMHALLLDRFKTADAVDWRKAGATVLPDLIATKDWLTSEELKCSDM
ncbi:hypothetical protein HAX54_021543 [Datura stramonium]|uniref:Haloacid dehalogenase-like hydrolase domain-containing protein 3 n=1 Tax=Datura stramonium TaxID=4076 RepID=A0ABS8S3G0_DATST|nr:hypothetical protein [Datura stramonium]